MKLLNDPTTEDYHIHSATFSDGMSDVDAIVVFAGKIGLKKIAITDHSRAVTEHYQEKKTPRGIATRWRNVHNKVEVSFGVEGDILNPNGEVCMDISRHMGNPLILSLHREVYGNDMTEVTEAYLKAIRRFFNEITMIGHLHLQESSKYLDAKKVIEEANRYGVPLEINCGAIARRLSDEAVLDQIIELADRCYVNSDAHTLNEMLDNKIAGWLYLSQRYGLEF